MAARLSKSCVTCPTGEHRLEVKCDRAVQVDRLTVTAIPELIHCGLGFDPAIKSYGHYDMKFLEKDVLPNVTTLIVPNNISLPQRRHRRLAPPGEKVRRGGRDQWPGQDSG